MARMHAIILGRRLEIDFGIRLRRIDIVIRRQLLEEGSLFGHIRIAILVHPRRARQQQVIAQHVQQRHLADNRPEQVRPLREHHAHQQPAIRAAHRAKLLLRRDLLRDHILGHRDEVVIDHLPLGLQPRLVPGRAELTAATDVRHHIDAALLQPQLAHRARIARRLAHLETAIAIDQRRVRTVVLDVLFPHDEVRHFRSILRCGVELVDHHARCVEPRRQRLDLRQRPARRVVSEQRIRRQVSVKAQERRRLFHIGEDHARRSVRRQRHFLARPARRTLAIRHHLHDDIVGDVHQQLVLRDAHALQRLLRRRAEHQLHLRQFARRDELAPLVADQVARLERTLPLRRPILLDRRDQRIREHALRARLLRQRNLHRLRPVAEQHIARREERLRTRCAEPALAVLVLQREGRRRHIFHVAAIDLHRLPQRLAALQPLHHERIAALGQRGRVPAPVGRDQKRVLVLPGDRALGLRDIEPARHERRLRSALRDRILAHARRILAAIRQR